MSSIIDALKRAETERLPLPGYELLKFHINFLPRGGSRKSRFLAGIGLMASLLFGSWVLIYSIFAGMGPDRASSHPVAAPVSRVQAPEKPAPSAALPTGGEGEAGREASLREKGSLKASGASTREGRSGDSLSRPTPPQNRGREMVETRALDSLRKQTPSQGSQEIQGSAPEPSRPSSRALAAGAPARERAESLFRAARAYEGGGNLGAAAEAYRAALALSPGLLEARLNLGNIYFGRGNYQEAIAQYLAALRADPTYAKAHTNLGVAYAEAGSLHLAVNEYKLSIRYEPNNFIPYFNLGGLYARLGRHEMALDYLKRALALSGEARTLALADPDYRSLKDNLAFRKFVKGS